MTENQREKTTEGFQSFRQPKFQISPQKLTVIPLLFLSFPRLSVHLAHPRLSPTASRLPPPAGSQIQDTWRSRRSRLLHSRLSRRARLLHCRLLRSKAPTQAAVLAAQAAVSSPLRGSRPPPPVIESRRHYLHARRQ